MKKLESLTALRFFAAAPIVIEHCKPAFQSMAWIPYARYDFGVSFFFVLSGFILSYSSIGFSNAHDVKRFYVSRIARIWPLHLFMLAAFLIALPSNWWFFGGTEGHRAEILLSNFFLVHAWVPCAAFFFSFNAVSWSISTEMFFYLVFPALRHRWERTWHWKSAIAIGLAFSVLSVATVNNVPTFDVMKAMAPSSTGLGYISPFVRIAEFVLGMLAWKAFDSAQPYVTRLGTPAWTFLEIASVALITKIANFDGSIFVSIVGEKNLSPTAWYEFIGHCSAAPAFALIVFVFGMGRGLVSKMISIRPLLILGEASFALYLCHQLIYIVFTNNRARFNQPDLLLCVGYWTVTLTVSLMLWSFVEIPARDWIRNRGPMRFRTSS